MKPMSRQELTAKRMATSMSAEEPIVESSPSAPAVARADGDSTPQGSSSFAVDSLLAAVIPLLGLTIYVMLRGTYVSLYSRLGITPEDVGTDYFAVLTGAARIFCLGNWEPGESPVIGSLCGLMVLAALFLILRFFRVRRYWSSPILRHRFGFLMVYLTVVLFMAATTIGIFAGVDRTRALDRIRIGERVRPGNMHFLTLQAYHVRLISVSGVQRATGSVDKGHQLEELLDSESLMYLGHADGFAIVYDFHIHRTWRLPESEVLLQIDPVLIRKD